MPEQEVTLLDVLKAVHQIGHKVDQLETRFESRFNQMEVRLDKLEAKLEWVIVEVKQLRQSVMETNERLDAHIAETRMRFDDTNKRFDEVNERLDAHIAETRMRFDETNKRFDEVNERLDTHIAETRMRFDDTRNRITILSNEVRADRMVYHQLYLKMNRKLQRSRHRG